MHRDSRAIKHILSLPLRSESVCLCSALHADAFNNLHSLRYDSYWSWTACGKKEHGGICSWLKAVNVSVDCNDSQIWLAQQHHVSDTWRLQSAGTLSWTHFGHLLTAAIEYCQTTQQQMVLKHTTAVLMWICKSFVQQHELNWPGVCSQLDLFIRGPPGLSVCLSGCGNLFLGSCSYILKQTAQLSSCFPPLQAFFTDTYIQEHPEDHERIEVLKQLIALQVSPSAVTATDTGLKARHVP